MQNWNNKTIIISNLPKSITKEDIVSVFGNFGDCKSFDLNNDDSNNIYAKYEYTDASNVSKALELNNTLMDDKEISVQLENVPEEIPQSQNQYSLSSEKVDYTNSVQIFVGDLSFEVDENLLKTEFGQFGSIIDVKIIRNNDGSSKGYGFISFEKREDADKAIQKMNRSNFYGKNIKCNWATRNTAGTDKFGSMSSGNNHRKPYDEIYNETVLSNTDVYVGGRNITEDQLRQHFQEFGRIVSIKAYPDRGHAFIRFDNHDTASHAIHYMDNSKIGNSTIRCNWGRKLTGGNSENGDYNSHTRGFSGQQRSNYGQQQMVPQSYTAAPQQPGNWNSYQDHYLAAMQQYQQYYSQPQNQQQASQYLAQQQPQNNAGAAAAAQQQYYQYYGQYPATANAAPVVPNNMQQQLYQQYYDQQQY